MADDKFPMIPLKAWWALRKKFDQAIPTSVTPGYVATTLKMNERSAKTNVINYLIKFGIVDQDGKPLPRANDWRDKEHYSEVCKQIREEIYPSELLDAVPGPVINRSAAESWFRRKTRVGEKAAQKMAAVYEMLWEADPSKGQETATKSPAAKPRRPTTPKLPVAVPVGGVTAQPAIEVPAASPAIKTKSLLSYEPIHVNFNIQIVLPENASEGTYNNIFKSIATYLLGRGEE